MTLALEVWDWCQERDILVIPSHIPGRDNVSADRESIEFTDMSEWKLDRIIIQPFLLNCQTDLFASRLTSQLVDYISWRPDPGAIHTDTFTINWATLRGYASLASSALVAGSAETPDISASVAPEQSNPVYGPDRFEPHSSNLSSSSLAHVSHLYQRFQTEAFQQTLPIYSSLQLVPPHTKPTTLVGTVGATGVLDGKLIIFRHL